MPLFNESDYALHRAIATFADGQLTDALRHMASDSTTDPKVKKKLTQVFASWHRQFKDDPSMSLVASFYKQNRAPPAPPPRASIDTSHESEQRLAKEEAKRKVKEAKEAERLKRESDRLQREQEAKRKHAPKSKRKPFNFEQVSNPLQTMNQALTSPRKSHRSLVPSLPHRRIRVI